jgi:isopropylmalate/homocitrate/citramalate synthase
MRQEVMEGIYRHPAVTYAVLTPNVKGYTAALRVSADEVAIFGSASEGFSQEKHQLLGRREHRTLQAAHGKGPSGRNAGARLCFLRHRLPL